MRFYFAFVFIFVFALFVFIVNSSNFLQLSQLNSKVFARYKTIITSFQIKIVQNAKIATNRAINETIFKLLKEKINEFESFKISILLLKKRKKKSIQNNKNEQIKRENRDEREKRKEIKKKNN